jgi:hypothetical protein
MGALILVDQNLNVIADLPLIDVSTIPVGSKVYLSVSGPGYWTLAVSTASVDHTTVEAVLNRPGLRWLIDSAGGTVTSISAGSGITVDSTVPAVPVIAASLTVGKSGGQTVIGDTAASGNLILESTSNSTKGKVEFGVAGTSYYSEVNDQYVSGKAGGSVGYGTGGTTTSGLGTASSGTGPALYTGGNVVFWHSSVADAMVLNKQLLANGHPISGNVTLTLESSNGVTGISMNDTTGVTVGAKRFRQTKGADVSSAAPLALGTDGNTFHITGTTSFAGIVTTSWQAGSCINLIFDGVLTITHNSGTPGANAVAVFLKSGANLTTGTNSTLRLVYDGSKWYEI